jgi:hypothetical protein
MFVLGAAAGCWLMALIEEAAVIERILDHLGLPAEIPAPRPARAPPVAERAGADGWADPSGLHARL